MTGKDKGVLVRAASASPIAAINGEADQTRNARARRSGIEIYYSTKQQESMLGSRRHYEHLAAVFTVDSEQQAVGARCRVDMKKSSAAAPH